MPVVAAGVLTSELPLHALAWQAGATLLFARAGALRSAAGRAGLALSTASWAALVGLHRDAQRSRDVLEQALTEALGPSYRKAIADRLGPAADVPLRRSEIALPRLGGRRRYAAARDIAYGDAGTRNHLDVWRRADLPHDAGAPVVLQIPGGAWVMGRKDDQAQPLLGHLAERGWVGASMNYRLSPKATWPDHVVDVKRAIAWVRATIADFGGDPAFIAVTGGSAGGHLSALAALTPNDAAFQPGFEAADTTVQAAVPLYGLFDLTNRTGGTRADTVAFLARHVFKSTPEDDGARWEAASPLCRISPTAPPFFVIHGTNDAFLPVEQTRAFVEELRGVSASPVAFAELPRTEHGFDWFSSVRVHHTVRAIERFLVHVHETVRR